MSGRVVLAVAALLVTCACAGGAGVSRADLALAEPTFGSDVVVGREEMAQSGDRSGNVRWFVDQQGCFYNARNQPLRVSADQLDDPDPAFHFNTDFPEEPQRCFDDDQLARLRAAVDQLDAGRLAADSPIGAADGVAEAVVRRWTVTDSSGTTHEIVAVRDQEPAELAELGALVDQLVVESAS